MDPESDFEVILKSDRERDFPDGRRPTFVFRHLTGRQWARAQKAEVEIVAVSDETVDAAANLDRLCEAIAEGLVGWRDVTGRDGNPVEFDSAGIDELVGIRELWELYYSMMRGGQLEADDAKKSESPSPTAGAGSAGSPGPQCRGRPSELEPAEFDCPLCGGDGCEHCDKATGRFALTACPLQYVTGDVWRAIEYATLYAKGLPPVAGGALDQARQFVQAARRIWAEEALWKARLKMPFWL